MTAPGTLIMCINADIRAFPSPYFKYARNAHLSGLTAGQVYTLRKIIPSKVSRNNFEVILEEIDRGYDPHSRKDEIGFDIGRFKIAQLPKSITSLLTSTPIKNDSKIKEIENV